MLKATFSDWAKRNGFRVITRASDTAVGTAILMKRSGRFVVETHPKLSAEKLAYYKKLGVSQDYAVEYPFGVKGLAEADLEAKLQPETFYDFAAFDPSKI